MRERAGVLRSGDHRRDDQEQIGAAGLLAGGGQQRVRLAAVVCLVVEESVMRSRFGARTSRSAAPLNHTMSASSQVSSTPAGPTRDVDNGLVARHAQLGEIL